MRRRFAAVALLGVLAACRRPPAAIPDILGQINEEYLTTDEFLHHFKMRGGMDLDGEPRAALKRFLVAEIVNRKLLLQEARRQRIKPSREDLRGTFAEQGGGAWEKPDRDRAWNVEDDLLEQRQIERLLRDALPAPGEPGSAEVKRMLAAHPELASRPMQIRLRQIVVHSAAMAERIAKRRKKGDDFAELVSIAGERPAKSAWAGEENLPAVLWAAANNTRDGRMVGPLRTEYGWNLVEVIGRRPAGPVPRADAAAAARRLILADRRRAATERYVAKLRARALIRLDLAAVGAL